jgi:hypothetical protein
MTFLHTHLPVRRAILVCMLASAGVVRPDAVAQKNPQEYRTFLSQYTGKEILLLDMTSDSLQFSDADSTQKFVVVLDQVGRDILVVHRNTGEDRRSFAYPIQAIRRITYLFGGHPYRRIVVEMF